MFEILGYVISLILLAIVVTLLTEYTKRFKFIAKLVKFFDEKVKKISWYQIDAMIIALILLIILNLLGATELGIISLILNAILIGFIANGLFTYEFVKSIMSKWKITKKIIEIIEPAKSVTKKTVSKKSK